MCGAGRCSCSPTGGTHGCAEAPGWGRGCLPQAARRASEARQTPIEYLAPGHGETKPGHLWACARPGGGTVFAWHASRAAACLGHIIPCGFHGTVQSDGYAAYPAFVRRHNAAAGREAITLSGCWAHARRGFHEARESAPRTAGWLLRHIAALYQIEAHLRERRTGPPACAKPCVPHTAR